jgi:hypothetical protein
MSYGEFYTNFPTNNRFHLTAFGAGTRASRSKPSFWFLKVAVPKPTAGEQLLLKLVPLWPGMY